MGIAEIYAYCIWEDPATDPSPILHLLDSLSAPPAETFYMFLHVFIEFYETGNVSKSYYYKNDLLDSAYYEFLPDGSISVEGYFNYGLKNGEWATFTEEGKLFSIGFYSNCLLYTSPSPRD